MDNQRENKIPILNIAWSRYAQLDKAAKRLSHLHYRLRRWIISLGVFSAIFAVLTEIYPDNFPVTGKFLLKILLIASPITVSLLAINYNKFRGGGGWLTMRASAEEIRKDIYIFRAVLKGELERRAWLEKRLEKIQRQVYRDLGEEMVLEKYTGSIPPYHNPENPESDPGYDDLNGDEYFSYRLEERLAWHIRRANRIQKERMRLQWYIGIAGTLGAASAVSDFYLLTTIIVAFAVAFISWQELYTLDNTLKNYNKVIAELTIIYDYWLNLESEERTRVETLKMVMTTEKILCNQNMEYIHSVQDASADTTLDEADLVEQVLKKSVEADVRFKKNLRDSIISQTDTKLREPEGTLGETFDKTLDSIAKEASSDLVQQELAAMAEAEPQVVENTINRASRLRSAMDEIAADYKDVEFSPKTPASDLHAMMQRFPKTGEVKG